MWLFCFGSLVGMHDNGFFADIKCFTAHLTDNQYRYRYVCMFFSPHLIAEIELIIIRM